MPQGIVLLNVSLADGFALATAQAERAGVATFDRRVRRALPKLGLELAPACPDITRRLNPYALAATPDLYTGRPCARSSAG